MKRFPSAVATGIVAGAFAFTGLVPVFATPRTQPFHVTKECSQYTGVAGSFCTITSSNVRAIDPGSRVIYTSAASATALDTDIVLVDGPGNRAFGHVLLDFTTGTGRVTLDGGTGQFRHFHAAAAVSHTGGIDWAWDGTSSFGSDD